MDFISLNTGLGDRMIRHILFLILRALSVSFNPTLDADDRASTQETGELCTCRPTYAITREGNVHCVIEKNEGLNQRVIATK